MFYFIERSVFIVWYILNTVVMTTVMTGSHVDECSEYIHIHVNGKRIKERKKIKDTQSTF